MTQNPRAVSILSGFLGSGKTTLLRRYLRECGGPDIAVVINEYGAVGVDHHLVRMVEERSVLLQGGCVCCSRREDLVGTLRELLDLEQSGQLAPIRQLVIETSGLADPVPILFTLTTDPVLRHHFVASPVVVTLDGVNATAQISRQPEVRKQISIADRVVITKPDLVPREQISRCRMQVRQLNPAAGIVVSSLGDRFDALAPQDRPDHVRGLSMEGDSDLPPNPHPEVRSGALIFDASLDWASFSVWLSMLLQARGPDVLRIKGLLDIGDAGPVVLNVAQHVVHPPEHLPVWPPGERRSHLTFITKGIGPDRIARSLETFQRAGGQTSPRLKVIA
jgi:G3E family GTPase